MCILVQTQAFSDAWVSLNEIIWTGGTGYRALDTIPDASFSTLSWTL
jgi:molybdopterin biosynthesis enzyme MoaB